MIDKRSKQLLLLGVLSCNLYAEELTEKDIAKTTIINFSRQDP